MNNEETKQQAEEEIVTATDKALEEKKWFRTHGHVLSFWRWFFLIGLIGLVIGYAGGRSGGRHSAMREMMKNQPHDMKTMMTTMNEVLKSKSGNELEQAFLEEMILHHEGAVEMAKTIKEGTRRPELKKLADDIITAQNQEIGMMKVWLSEWFGSKMEHFNHQ